MTGSPNAEAVEWMRRMHDLARQGLPPLTEYTQTAQTPAYLDLIFAFGHASLGASDPCRQLLAAAQDALSSLDEAHQFLFRAYDYRISQVLGGKPHAGPLPNDHLDYLEHMERWLRYIVDQLRKHSRILEPDQGINPYRWGSFISDLGRELAELQDMTDCLEAAARVDRLLGEVPNNAKGTKQRVQVVRAGLEAAPRVGEEFGHKMLKEALAVCAVNGQMEPREADTLLARAITLAHRLGDLEVLPILVDHSLEALRRRGLNQQIPWWILDLIRACIEGLIAANRPEDLDVLLYETSSDVLNGRTVDQLAMEREGDTSRLRALLVLTRGWFALKWDSKAWPVLNVAFDWLSRSSLAVRDQVELACATANALSVATSTADAGSRLEDVLRVLPSSRDTYTTASHFAISTLKLAESVVLAAVKVWTRDGSPSPSPNPVTH